MIDKSTVEQARKTDVVAFIKQRYGLTFDERSGAYRCREHKSLAIKSDRLSWFWHSKGIGGFGALDYIIKVENVSFIRAMEILTSAIAVSFPTQQIKQTKTLALPEKSDHTLRLYNYLCQKRCIDSNIITALIQKENLYEDRRGNVVFVGRDEHGTARFASLRGTYSDSSFRGDCAGSDKRYGFIITASALSECLYIFESAIDAMSHASLANGNTGDLEAWRRHNRLSLAGTSDTAIPFFLNKHTYVSELVFCLDNDSAGHKSARFMARKYADLGYKVRYELPSGKDFNEDLCFLSSSREV